MNKQVLAALEINDGEVKLIVCEMFNSRLNVLKTERVIYDNFQCDIFNDYKKIINAIEKAVSNASKRLGVAIKSVVLCVPSLNFNRFPLRVKVDVDDSFGKVSLEDISRAYRKVLKTPLSDNNSLVNAYITKYYTGGITTRKMPLNERVNELFMDVDLLCSSRDLTYQYVTIVESAGLKIVDIFLDSFAVCKEAALLEQTIANKILLVKFDRTTTNLTLLANGRVASSKTIYKGLNNWFNTAMSKLGLSYEVISKLVTYNLNFNTISHNISPIYIWQKDGQTMTLNEKELFEAINDEINNWTSELTTIVEELKENNDFSLVISGVGAELTGFDMYLNRIFGVNVKNYIPETLGARNGVFATTLGSIYAYKDIMNLKSYPQSSVDVVAYQNMITNVEKYEENDGLEKTVTSKLFNLFDKKNRESEA